MDPSHEAAMALLRKAQDDRQAYYALAADQSMAAWLVGFHAQQAIEKAVKSVLSSASVEYPRTHNLSMLVGLLRQHGFLLPPDADEFAQLTPFGAALRYNEASPIDEGDTVDRVWTGPCIDRTIAWAESCVSGGGAP